MTQNKLSLKAEERTVLGKKVKKLRINGKLPGHVYGRGIETEHVTVDAKEFLKVADLAGETGLIELKIGVEKTRPVLLRDVQFDPVSNLPIHIDFYQVNLKEKVTVPVPLVLVGEDPEKVHLGEAIVLQTLNEVQVEALPTDLVEKIEVSIESLKEIGDAITVENLNYDRSKLTVLAALEEVVVKLAPAVTAEMEKLLEEEAAEAAAAQAETVAEGAEPVEGGEGGVAEGEPASADSASVATSAKEAATADKEGEAGSARAQEEPTKAENLDKTEQK